MKTFPDGSLRAVTFSYDDANVADERLVALFNHYGLKATFNVNSGLSRRSDRPDLIPADRFPALYAGHEVASHTLTHPNLLEVPPARAREEVAQDRAFLSAAVGYPVVGFAYPYGGFDETVWALLRQEGFLYARTTEGTGDFALPAQPLRWRPTCHHHTAAACLDRFLADETPSPRLLYIWGHSYEFDREDTWEEMERLCIRLAARPDIWKATNREVLAALSAG